MLFYNQPSDPETYANTLWETISISITPTDIEPSRSYTLCFSPSIANNVTHDFQSDFCPNHIYIFICDPVYAFHDVTFDWNFLYIHEIAQHAPLF